VGKSKTVSRQRFNKINNLVHFGEKNSTFVSRGRCEVTGL
jgi:hypothetical protein